MLGFGAVAETALAEVPAYVSQAWRRLTAQEGDGVLNRDAPRRFTRRNVISAEEEDIALLLLLS